MVHVQVQVITVTYSNYSHTFILLVSFYHAFHSDLHWSWNKKNRKFNRRWMPVRDSQQFRPIKEASLKNNYFGSSLHCSGWVLSCSVSTLSSCSVESSLVERGLQSSWASVAVALGQLPHSIWHLRFPTRDRTHMPCTVNWILNHWTTREVPKTSLSSVTPSPSRTFMFPGSCGQD